MAVNAKTIQIYLPEGEPRGLRIAEITTRIVQAIQLPRTKLDQFFCRAEADQIGVYFLFGQSAERVKPVAYVGQTEDLRGRLKNHNANKDFWSSAVVIVSRTQSFTQAHIRYLEWLSLQRATDAQRFDWKMAITPLGLLCLSLWKRMYLMPLKQRKFYWQYLVFRFLSHLLDFPPLDNAVKYLCVAARLLTVAECW